MNEGDNPPIGTILCADKSESVVKYTLPENETQIFASKYKLYLPSAMISGNGEEKLAQIYIDGEERTNQITDWKIGTAGSGGLCLSITYVSGKKYTAELSRCRIIPTKRIDGNLMVVRGQNTVQMIEEAIEYGGKYTVIKYPAGEKRYCRRSEDVEIQKSTMIKNEPIFSYFKEIAKERTKNSDETNHKIAETVVSQLEDVVPHVSTALHAYCYKNIKKRQKPAHLIYPFGLNESQLEAVENAFLSQISIIEGPPGTGKTQTILNIISNILLQKKTVAVISNNNPAVKNIYEKMERANLDYLIARLGSSANINSFFEEKTEKAAETIKKEINIQTIDEILNKVKSHLHAKNEAARLKAELDEIKIEIDYLEEWGRNSFTISPAPLEHYKLSPDKLTDLLAYLDYLADRKISFSAKLRLLFQFKIIRTRFLDETEARNHFVYSLQFTYYQKVYGEKEKLLRQYEKILEKNQYDQLLKRLTSDSMKHLKYELAKTIPDSKMEFTARDYRKNFEAFLKFYPVIGSSTFSIVRSIGKGTLLDYVIIDEASQQDIVPGILGLGCAKNVIIVGDRKQLPHIPTASKIGCPDDMYDCTQYSLLDSFVKIFRNKVPITLLKEHYRCHPKIIQFCNKQFYEEQLIPMTQDHGERALELILTSRGNHTRQFTNLREIESVKEVGVEKSDDIGFIAPYNDQINLAGKLLPQDLVKATIHKFQGRECREIIFSTVLDKKISSQNRIDFVDNPELVNVAVSRAKEKFTLVTDQDAFERNNQSIAALIRYMKYYAATEDFYDSPLISAFDLLYHEYDRSLEKLNVRLNPKDSRYKSEQIGTQLLRETLEEEQFRTLKFHKQVKLIQVVSLKEDVFTEREVAYMRNRASCDLVIYYKVGKQPLAAIEIDGGYHERPEQKERDALKDSILKKAGVPLLRIRTVEAHVENKITEFLHQCLKGG